MMLSAWRSRFLFLSVVTAVCLLTLLPPARAADVQVVCPGGGPGAFPSITEALNTLNPNDANTITVSGTCVENVSINTFERLVIQSASGQTATITALDPSRGVFRTDLSTGILLSGLVFQGGQGVFLALGSNVTIVNCTIQQSSGEAGLHLQASALVMENSTIQDNHGNGIQLNGASHVTLATTPNQRIRVLRNGGDGILLDGSYLQVNFGTLDVENNARAAIFQFGGRSLIFGGRGVGGGNLFQGNGEGILVNNAGSAQFSGRNVIQNNGDVGLQVWGSSVFIAGSILPDGTLDATVIGGHARVGVNVVRLGELTMNGPHQIQNNGSAAADPAVRGGIRVSRSSLDLLNGVQISNNTGPGIRADQNTSTTVTNVTISSNSEEGVHVDRQSVAGFSQPLSIVGNGIASISCDTTSLVFGDLTGVAGINCMQIERQVGPPRPGRVIP